MKVGASLPRRPRLAWPCEVSAPRDARLHLPWLLRRNAHLSFEIIVEMCLDGAKRFLISFKAVEHDGTSRDEMMSVASFFASILGRLSRALIPALITEMI